MNEPSVDLNLLRTFYEVARTGSVSRAARALHRSQPAISHRLRALEDSLGVAVFERIGQKLRLTEAGRAVLERTQQIMALSASLSRDLSEAPDRIEGALTIGTLPTLSSQLLARPLGRFLSDHPRLRLEVRFGLVDELAEQLRVGRIDVALVIDHRPPAALEARELGKIRLTAIFAPDAVRNRARTVSVRELRRHRYLAWTGLNDPTIELVEQYARRFDLSDPGSPRIPHIETLRELVASGVGYAIVPEYTVWADARARRLILHAPAGLRASIPLYALTRTTRDDSPALRRLLVLLDDASRPLARG